MGDNYVELIWRVIKGRELRGAFQDLDDAEKFAKLIDGRVIVLSHRFVERKS